MLATPHPTSEVGQQMMTRLAMGSPPNRGCPLLLSSVHSRLRKKGTQAEAEVGGQPVAPTRDLRKARSSTAAPPALPWSNNGLTNLAVVGTA